MKRSSQLGAGKSRIHPAGLRQGSYLPGRAWWSLPSVC